MLHTHEPIAPTSFSNSQTISVPRNDLFLSVLESTETGVAVVDTHGQTVYLNSSARQILAIQSSLLPAWCHAPLLGMIERMRTSGEQVVEKWCYEGTTFRVRGRSLDQWSGHIALEISIAYADSTQSVADVLSRSLSLSRTDSSLLELLWRGMSNEEIATQLRVRIGTVKSRLFRLYQKLGVRRRPAAVLRAAEVIGR